MDFDARQRPIDSPSPGFWLIRCVPAGPWCPAAIMWLHTRAEPGQSDNLMERSPFLAAFISGHPVALGEVWHRRGQGISRAFYDQAIAEIAEAVRRNVYDPRWHPLKPVAIESLPVPFQEEADAKARRPNLRRMQQNTRSNP